MMNKLDGLPHTKKAVLILAYDNGRINRTSTEADYLAKVEEVLGSDGYYQMDLEEIDGYLGELLPEEMETLCAGEEGDIRALVQDLNTRHTDQGFGPDLLPLGDAIQGMLTDVFEMEP